MKIGIDVSQIIYETGVSEYTINLVRSLLIEDKHNEYILFGSSLRRLSELKKFASSLEGKFEPKFLPIPPTLADILWNHLHVLTIETFTGDIDIFHSSDWAEPPSRCPKITTVHDLAPIKYPNLTHPRVVSTHRRRLTWVKKESKIIISPSQSTKNDLIDLGFDKKKIRVVYEAPDKDFKPDSGNKIVKIKEKYNITKNYILSIGIGKRKNTQRLIEAFRRLNYLDLELVLVGENNMNIPIPKNIILTGHVAKDDLISLLSGAEALAYVSIYEGFGLPILQAYACKCPVLTSNTASMKEVSGGASLLVNPYEIESIKDGIIKTIKERNRWIDKGLDRLKFFSWKKTAQETLKVYNEVVKTSP
jgi:glycosyltransferase involved in cell wall biosynthesis